MTTVIVPWRAGCDSRERAYGWVRSRLVALGLDVIEATDDGEPFSKSAAIMRAVARSDADRFVIHDADVWCDDTMRAVDELERHQWTVPHLQVWRLSEAGTTQLIDSGQARPDDCVERHRGVIGGGIVCVRRDVLERVPFDPRFRGWGGEDVAWGHAARVLVGEPFRFAGVCHHLWHPPEPRRTRALPLRDESRRLVLRYLDARRRADVLEAIVGEAREALKDF